MGIMQDKYLNVSRVAEELVMKNIWPSYIQIDKHFNATPTGRSYSRYYLRKWKDKIGLKRISSAVSVFGNSFSVNECGDICDGFRLTYNNKILCPVHYKVKDL